MISFFFRFVVISLFLFLSRATNDGASLLSVMLPRRALSCVACRSLSTPTTSSLPVSQRPSFRSYASLQGLPCYSLFQCVARVFPHLPLCSLLFFFIHTSVFFSALSSLRSPSSLQCLVARRPAVEFCPPASPSLPVFLVSLHCAHAKRGEGRVRASIDPALLSPAAASADGVVI